MLVTTSSYSKDAHVLQEKHKYELSLRDYLMVGTSHNDACMFTYNSLLLYVKMQPKNRTHGVLIADVVESRSHSHCRR